MDYEIEVKKIHPNAGAYIYGGWSILSDLVNRTILSDECETPAEAWQSAYQKLKQQGKIK